MKKKTLTIIGSGPGGYVAAVRAAQLGCAVTVIERNGLGGVCLQHGCIPVKALLRSANVLETMRNSSSYGVACSDMGFDFTRMMQRKNDIVSINEQGIEALFRKHRITFIRGTGKLVSLSRIEVTDIKSGVIPIESDACIIATGSSSVIPAGIELDRKRIFDCEGALALQSLPSSIIILGGGILGCEFASLFNSLGVAVTVIEKLPLLMPSWDTDLSRALVRSFKKRSVIVRTDTAVRDVCMDAETGGIRVTLSTGEFLNAESCLVALGRKPNIENIGLEEAGIALWKERYRGIQVNEYMETSVSGIYAVGDVTGIRPLAHIASAQGITAVEHFCGNGSPLYYNAVPDCFWASPELASVGITEQEALESGLNVRVATVHYRSSGIAHALGTPEGFVKVIAEKGSWKVLGIHICGHSAPEMIAEASVIVANNLTVDDVKNTIHAHPTMGEIVKEAVLAVREENIHG